MKKYILFFAMACLVAACSNDIATSELTTQKATLNLLLSAAPNVASRAINAQADGKIYDCTVITFDKNGNVSGKGYQTVDGGVDRFNMAVGLSTNKGEKCKVYAVANTNNPTLFDNVTDLTSFLDMYVTIASPEALTAGNINVCAGASSTALTTQGQLMVSDSLPVTITDGVVPFRLTLYSQCAKVNFEINAEMGDAINGFTVTGYRLFKVPLSGYLHQKYDASTVDIRFSAPDGQYGNFPRVDLNGRPTNVQFTYYIQENHQGRRSGATNSKTRIAANAPDNATYLEVYVQKNGRNGTYRYYLGNLLEDVNQSHYDYYNLLRGSDYYITININDIDENDDRFVWDE